MINKILFYSISEIFQFNFHSHERYCAIPNCSSFTWLKKIHLPLFFFGKYWLLAQESPCSYVDLLEVNYRDRQVPNSVKQIRSEKWGCICPHQDGEQRDVEGWGGRDCAICWLIFEKNKGPSLPVRHSFSFSLSHHYALWLFLCLGLGQSCVRNISSATACFISGQDWSINDTAAIAFAHCITKLHFN